MHFLLRRFFKKAGFENGFTLLEISISLIILGFVLVPVFAMIVQQDMEEQATENVLSRDRAIAALNFYLKQYGSYPLPANPALAPDDAGFGAQDPTRPVLGPAGSRVRSGALPVTALGLPFDAAVNEYGWKYMYTVTDDLTRPGDFDGVGEIQVRGLSAANVAGGVHYVVVDPGRDGKGSFNLEGTASGQACAIALDAENCDAVNPFLFLDAGEQSVADYADANFYDDVIHYRHVDNKNDFWVINDSDDAGVLEISNRNLGDVGFGTETPGARLDVNGNVVVGVNSAGAAGGSVTVQNDIDVDRTLWANSIVVDGSSARVDAEAFCSGGWAYESAGGAACCTQRVYRDVSGNDICGLSCRNGEILGNNGNCCARRSQLDDAGDCP